MIAVELSETLDPPLGRCSNNILHRVDSEKLRKDVGWKPKRQLFSEGLRIYRKAYEATRDQKHTNV